MSTDLVVSQLKRFYFRNHYLPSIRELCKFMGKDDNYRTQVKRLLDGLVATRYLQQTETGKYVPGNKFFNYPVYHSVQAGHFTPASELMDYINLEEYLIRKPNDTLIIQVNGDSMTEAGIDSGDLVIVEQRTNCKDGEIVVIEKNSEYTVKYYRQAKSGEVYLEPANSKYSAIKFADEENAKLIGVVTKCIKNFN
jgi:DNA polymerase V